MTVALRRSLVATVCAAVLFLAGLVLFAVWRESQAEPSTHLEYSKLYLDAFKVIIISFFVAMVGVLLPALSAETRYAFERLKESRVAYSDPKTSVHYLPITLCSLSLAEANAMLQKVHFQKHQAELYSELKQHLKRSGLTADRWGDEMYFRLIDYRRVLEDHVSDWDQLASPARLGFLLESRRRLDRAYPPPAPLGNAGEQTAGPA